MTFVTRLIAAALLSSATFSVAQGADLTGPVEQPVPAMNGAGFYVGTINTINFLDDTSFAVGGGAATINNDYETGFYSALRAGYNFGSMGFVSPRLELEVGYGSASIDYHSIAGGASFASIDSYGDARTIQGYVNGYIDIPLATDGAFSAITPFIGGGVGAMNLELRKQGVAGVGTLMDDSDTAFAYHLDAGVGINLQSIFTNTALFEGSTLEVGYRYTGTSDFDFTARDGTSSSTDFTSNSVTVGFRKQF